MLFFDQGVSLVHDTWMVKVPLAASVCRWISIGAASPPDVIILCRSFSSASLPLEMSSLMNT